MPLISVGPQLVAERRPGIYVFAPKGRSTIARGGSPWTGPSQPHVFAPKGRSTIARGGSPWRTRLCLPPERGGASSVPYVPLVPFDLVPAEERPVLILERHHPVVLGLVVNVFAHVRNAGQADAKRAVSGLPSAPTEGRELRVHQLEETDLTSRTRSATEIVRPSETSKWMWSGIPPTSDNTHPRSRTIPPKYGYNRTARSGVTHRSRFFVLQMT